PALGKQEVKIVDLGDAESIDIAVVAMRQAINSVYVIDAETARITHVDVAALRLFAKTCRRLSDLVLCPLLQAAGEIGEVTISPDFGLWLVPWNALMLDDGRFAIEQYEIRYLASGRELVEPAGPKRQGRPLIVASPDFDLDADTARQITEAVLAGKKVPPT